MRHRRHGLIVEFLRPNWHDCPRGLSKLNRAVWHIQIGAGQPLQPQRQRFVGIVFQRQLKRGIRRIEIVRQLTVNHPIQRMRQRIKRILGKRGLSITTCSGQIGGTAVRKPMFKPQHVPDTLPALHRWVAVFTLIQ